MVNVTCSADDLLALLCIRSLQLHVVSRSAGRARACENMQPNFAVALAGHCLDEEHLGRSWHGAHSPGWLLGPWLDRSILAHAIRFHVKIVKGSHSILLMLMLEPINV